MYIEVVKVHSKGGPWPRVIAISDLWLNFTLLLTPFSMIVRSETTFVPRSKVYSLCQNQNVLFGNLALKWEPLTGMKINISYFPQLIKVNVDKFVELALLIP